MQGSIHQQLISLTLFSSICSTALPLMSSFYSLYARIALLIFKLLSNTPLLTQILQFSITSHYSLHLSSREQTAIPFPAPLDSEDASDVSNISDRDPSGVRLHLESDCRVKGGAVQKKSCSNSCHSDLCIRHNGIQLGGILAQVN